MATMSPLLIPTDAAAPLVTPPRSHALPSDGAMLPDGAVPRVSEDDIGRRARDGGELAQVKRDLRNATPRDRAGAAASNKPWRATSHDVHGARRRERSAARGRARRRGGSRAERSGTTRRGRSRPPLPCVWHGSKS